MKDNQIFQKNLLPVLFWLAPVLLGFALLLDYHTRSGPAAEPPSIWPAASTLSREAGKRTLVAFLHPRCPCTAATISELTRLLPHLDSVKAIAVVTCPPGTHTDFAKTTAMERCQNIPGLQTVIDEQALETKRFKAVTSGMVLVYDEWGKLRFCGGITPGRGHEGDSAGQDMIESLVGAKNANSMDETGTAQKFKQCRSGTALSCPVFGCPLLHDKHQEEATRVSAAETERSPVERENKISAPSREPGLTR